MCVCILQQGLTLQILSNTGCHEKKLKNFYLKTNARFWKLICSRALILKIFLKKFLWKFEDFETLKKPEKKFI